ncbi:MFS transporter [Streptomyces boninensis]|uniref:MFS transporter n=1 Tax=Streptomyces boninensis TaxID=2039455 RepID=UPI003B228C0F
MTVEDAGRAASGIGKQPRAETDGGPPHAWWRTTVISLALLLEGMSSSSINVQVAEIAAEFRPGPALLSLVVTAFLVGYAGLLPVAGRLGDARDRRAVFLSGVALFGAGCTLCALAPGAWVVAAGRFVQGAGAALSAPAALALITAGLPAGARRNRVVALFGAMGAAGFSLGLVLPGFVVTWLGWRAGFAILLPVVLLVLAVCSRLSPAAGKAPQRVDWTGAALLTAALLLAVHAVAGTGGSAAWLVAAEFAAAGAAGAALVRRGGIDGFPAAAVRAPRVLACCVALAAVFAAVLGSMYVISLELQLGRSVDPFRVSLLILPQPVAFSLLSAYGARIVTRLGVGRALAAGMALILLALGLLAASDEGVRPAYGVLPAMVLTGAGLALCFPAATIGAVDAASEHCRATVSGVVTTWQNVGGAGGMALLTALALVPRPGAVGPAGPGMLVAAGFLLVGGAAAWLVARGRRAVSP